MNNDSDSAPPVPTPSNDLYGIPGIGPARRVALAAAGVNSRSDLSRASVEQMVSMTGMPRAQAEKVLAFVRTQVPPPEVTPSADEAMPAPDAAAVEALPSPDAPEETPLLTDRDRALFAARTALSDITRIFNAARWEKPFARFAAVLDNLTLKAGNLSPKRQKELTNRLLKLTQRWEQIAGSKAKRSKKSERRLREQLREDRRALTEMITGRVKKLEKKS